jgi:hypothetical protein
MSQPWAVCLEGADAAAVGLLRTTPGIRACAVEGQVWLRGDAWDDSLVLALRCLPGARRYAVADDGQLRTLGSRVPTGQLPAGPWTALPEWLRPELPSAAMPRGVPRRVPLKLVRSAEEQPATIVIVSLQAWYEYATHCPHVRLDRWQFAASAEGRVLVRGLPLPPLPGEQYVVSESIALPAGWRLDPPIDAAALRPLLQLNEHDLALMQLDGTWQRLTANDFVRASRSAVRATRERQRPPA